MAAYWEIATHSAYDMFSKYKYLFVNLFFSHLGFWSGNFILIVPFPGHCLLVPFLKIFVLCMHFITIKHIPIFFMSLFHYQIPFLLGKYILSKFIPLQTNNIVKLAVKIHISLAR